MLVRFHVWLAGVAIIAVAGFVVRGKSRTALDDAVEPLIVGCVALIWPLALPWMLVVGVVVGVRRLLGRSS